MQISLKFLLDYIYIISKNYKGLNMYFVPIKLASFGIGPCKFVFFFFIQIFPKNLVLIPTVSLYPLSDDVNYGESRHCSHMAA